MRLVDTSAWIEWLIGSTLGDRIAGELPAREQWLVPTIVQLELAKWLTRNGWVFNHHGRDCCLRRPPSAG